MNIQIFVLIHIYVIRFCQKKRFKIGLRKSIMYIIIFLITIFHWMMALWWHTFKGVTVVNDYTGNNREFVRCEYSISKHIRYKKIYS